MTLDHFLTTIYVPLKLRGRSPESVRLLRHAITQFGRFLGRPATLLDLEDLLVSQFLAARAARLAPESVARERSGLVALWNLAQARGLVRLRPAVAPELVPQRTPRALTADELHRVAAAAASLRGWIGPVPAGLWFATLVGVLLYTGERITATLSVPRDRWRRPWLVVPPHTRKGRRQERVYELPPWTADQVDELLRAHGAPVLFPWPCSGTALRKRWRTIMKRAGLGEGREFTPHVMRRTCASHLAAATGGADVATRHLGHSSDAVTRRSYLDPRILGERQAKPWELLPRIGGG